MLSSSQYSIRPIVADMRLSAPPIPKALQRTYRMALDYTAWEHRCCSCGEWKPANAETFQRSASIKTGLGNLCLDCNRKATRKWQIANPAGCRNQAVRHLGRRAQAAGSFSVADRKMLMDLYLGCCVSCGKHESQLSSVMHMDHVIPPPEGSNDSSNRQPLCRRCSQVKGTRRIDYRLTFFDRHFPGMVN